MIDDLHLDGDDEGGTADQSTEVNRPHRSLVSWTRLRGRYGDDRVENKACTLTCNNICRREERRIGRRRREGRDRE